jgi:threonyl-tRNA synthetase
VVGDDDVATETVGVNPRGGEVIRDVKFADFVKQLQDETVDATTGATTDTIGTAL